MGSKTKLLPFVINGINDIYNGGGVCDLFAGSCSLSGALCDQIPMISNDIQEYSSVIAKTYLTDWNDYNLTVDSVIADAVRYYDSQYKDMVVDYRYPLEINLDVFNEIELRSRKLINRSFSNEWHLFTKYYSGTWWSVEQCTWIDSLRKAIEDYKESPMYNTLLSCLMFAASYNSQGTGHYAQYRDAKTISTMNDIMIYRSKNILDFFVRKATDAFSQARKKPSLFAHQIMSEDYLDCLRSVKKSTVYADPPYCFVHYSRFYHALETLVLYDYPQIQEKNGQIVKGRYRINRHQSPFCIRTKVEDAFRGMFELIARNKNSLALSYSDTGMIPFEQLKLIAEEFFPKRLISVKSLNYDHMTMGRKDDRKRSVKEILLLIQSSK